nr:MAG TPA: hypothetical protein [Caudoviricetes sp.]
MTSRLHQYLTEKPLEAIENNRFARDFCPWTNQDVLFFPLFWQFLCQAGLRSCFLQISRW